MLEGFQIALYDVPSDRPIGDRRVRIERLRVGALQLIDASGQEGLGFFSSLEAPFPAHARLQAFFEDSVWPQLVGRAAAGLALAVPEAGRKALPFNLDNAIDQALWDLAAKRAGLPLHRLLGAGVDTVEAYASGLCYPLSEAALQDFYACARADGYRAFKLKVGHPDPDWDLRRLAAVAEAVGPGARLMADANEAWTPQETLRRLALYRRAGFELHWIEDPIARGDIEGLRALTASGCGVAINAGEVLDAAGRLELLQNDAADVVNINDGISDGLRIGWACAAKGRAVTLGNTIMNIGAHLGAALPGLDLVEDSRLAWTQLLAAPLAVEEGAFRLPDRPGHGLSLCAEACAAFEIG